MRIFLCKKDQMIQESWKLDSKSRWDFFPDGEEYHICPLDVEWDGAQKQSMGIIIIIILKKPPSCFAFILTKLLHSSKNNHNKEVLLESKQNLPPKILSPLESWSRMSHSTKTGLSFTSHSCLGPHVYRFWPFIASLSQSHEKVESLAWAGVIKSALNLEYSRLVVNNSPRPVDCTEVLSLLIIAIARHSRILSKYWTIIRKSS